MKLSVLIPYRPDTTHRERIYHYTSRLWKDTGVEVIYADDGLSGPLFSFPKAINAARRKATGNCFLSYSVDALPPDPKVLTALAARLKAIPWIAGWRGQIRFNEPQTESLLAGLTPAHVGHPAGGICIGKEALVAVRADVWDTLGGYDEAFVGWGPEDKAWHLALTTLFPTGVDWPSGDLWQSLWHPSTPRTMLETNVALFKEYRKWAANPVDFKRWHSTRQNPPVPTH